MAGLQVTNTCALEGCNKPPWPSVAGCITPHLTCGNLHHQLLMASRFNPALPHPFQLILHRNALGLCALLSCENPPWPGHSWCKRNHYLLWLTDFTSSLHPDQICKLPGCTRHVFVDDNAPPSQFCGWRHEQKFVMLSALNQCHQQEALPPAMEPHPQEPPSPVPSIESEYCGQLTVVPSLHSLMHSLKRFALSEIPPENIRVVDDFYEKHPSEVFTELGEGHAACLLIARLKFTSKGLRKLTTKGHYHWKQSGPRAKRSKLYTAKYYTYVKRKGRGKEGDEAHIAAAESSSYTMKEYTMVGVREWSLIQLVKDKLPSSHSKLRKELQPMQTHEQVQGVEVSNINACSQDLWNSDMQYLWNDETSVDSMDSIFGGLAPLIRVPPHAMEVTVGTSL